MFEDSIVETRISGAKKAATLMISTLAHVALVGALIIVPLLITDVLPAGGGTGSGGVMLAPGFGSAPPPPPAPLAGSTAPRESTTNTVAEVEPTIDLPDIPTPDVTVADPVIAVRMRVPERMAGLESLGDPTGIADGSPDGEPGGERGGEKGGTRGGKVGSTGGGCAAIGCGTLGDGDGSGLLGMRTAAPPPRPVEIARVVPTPKPPTQPPPPPPPVNIQPIDKVVRVGEGVQKANCIKCEPPEYPTLARTARVTDTVVLSALINKQGQIENLTVVRGHVLLRDATVKAVREWRYKPTLLNGEAVEVQTTISISFVFRQ